MKPILFSTVMVQAILEGRKTMTRRIVKGTALQWLDQDFNPAFVADADNDLCPYGKVGDVLWVRETTCYVMLDHAHDLLEGAKDRTQFVYKANVHPDWMEYAKEKYNYKWKPSIFMPKAACRIFLKITDISIEPLHAISGSDVLGEGIDNGKSNKAMGERWENMQRMAFEALWNKINKNWNDNPWVWVVRFEKVDKPDNF